MFPMEKAVWNLLKDHITYDDETIIPLVRRLTSEDETPCITIEQAAETQLKREILATDVEKIRLRNNAEVWINIWCDSEEQRHSLIQQVELRIFQALSNHYTTCDKYSEGHCTSLDKPCEVTTIDNGRTSKNQCPYPKENQYVNWFSKHHIIKKTFRISGRSNMDELDIAKPVLRTLIQLDMDYYNTYLVGGRTFTDFIIEE